MADTQERLCLNPDCGWVMPDVPECPNPDCRWVNPVFTGTVDKVQEVIVMRKELRTRRGKEVAQGSHAAQAPFSDRVVGREDYVDDRGIEMARLVMEVPRVMADWLLEGAFTKVVVQTKTEEEFYAVRDAAEAAGLPFRIITDRGHTEFHGIPTDTCMSVGPAWKSDLDPVTGHLPLY